MQFEDLLKSLKEFGFSQYEAKILAYLLLRGESSAPEMSKNLNIPNTKIYYVLDRLYNRGYIKKRYTSPVVYYLDRKDFFFDNVIDSLYSRIQYLEKLRDNILLSLSFSTETKVVTSESEFLYYLSLNLREVKILCNKRYLKYSSYIRNKKEVLNVVYVNIPVFAMLSKEVFLFGVFKNDDFSIGFVTSECLDKLVYMFNNV